MGAAFKQKPSVIWALESLETLFASEANFDDVSRLRAYRALELLKSVFIQSGEAFWHHAAQERPTMDRSLCLIVQNKKVHPEFCVWFEAKQAFSMPCLYPDVKRDADWAKIEDVQAWAYKKDLPPYEPREEKK